MIDLLCCKAKQPGLPLSPPALDGKQQMDHSAVLPSCCFTRGSGVSTQLKA